MTIFGKRLSEYVAFSKHFLILILVVGLARLALSLGGVPNSTAKWFSVSALLAIALLYYSIRVHTTGFGSYMQLLPILMLLSIAANLVVIVGIVIAIFTGTDNIFSAPEYSGGEDGKTWLHVLAHVVLGLALGPLVVWLVGCLIMFVVKKLAPRSSATAANA